MCAVSQASSECTSATRLSSALYWQPQCGSSGKRSTGLQARGNGRIHRHDARAGSGPSIGAYLALAGSGMKTIKAPLSVAPIHRSMARARAGNSVGASFCFPIQGKQRVAVLLFTNERLLREFTEFRNHPAPLEKFPHLFVFVFLLRVTAYYRALSRRTTPLCEAEVDGRRIERGRWDSMF